MKLKLMLILLLLWQKMLCQESGSIFDVDSIIGLSKEEVYEKYAYDDTSKALINKYYSSRTQGLVVGSISTFAAILAGVSTYGLMMEPRDYYYHITVEPFIILYGGATIILTSAAVVSFFMIHSKRRLIESLKYYHKNGVLKLKDRKGIKYYMASG